MKKILFSFVAFMLLGLSFAKAQFTDGNYSIEPEQRGYAKKNVYVSNSRDYLVAWESSTPSILIIKSEGNGYYSIESGGKYMRVEGRDIIFQSTKSDYSLWSFQENPSYDKGVGNIRMRTHSIRNKATGTYLDAPRGIVTSGTKMINYKEQRNPNSKTMDANQCWFIRKI
jgi:hypothetical protein